ATRWRRCPRPPARTRIRWYACSSAPIVTAPRCCPRSSGWRTKRASSDGATPRRRPVASPSSSSSPSCSASSPPSGSRLWFSPMHVRAGIYCRISQDRDGRALGVARQERDCRRIATERKWNVVDVYIDNDRSASKRNVHRPEYERLLADITNHRIDAVVVWNLDRLTRQPRQLESFVDVCEEAGMTRFATVTGDVNLTTADGITLARITGAFAAGEVRKISDRVKRKALEVAEHGRPWGGGRHPIGFAANRIDHDQIDAPALHDAARAILDGSTIVDAARTLIDRGVLNPPDHRAATVLKRVLCSPRVTGLREYKGEIVGTAVWDPIIDRPTWEQLRAVLQRPSRYSVPHRR